jgi:hypothetical protein
MQEFAMGKLFLAAVIGFNVTAMVAPATAFGLMVGFGAVMGLTALACVGLTIIGIIRDAKEDARIGREIEEGRSWERIGR